MIFLMLCLTNFTQYDNLEVQWYSCILFSWLSNIPLYICTTSYLSIPLSMDISIKPQL